jgi:hypothetical protein
MEWLASTDARDDAAVRTALRRWVPEYAPTATAAPERAASKVNAAAR